MKTTSLYMESTTIEPDRTAGEITALLVSSGASSISYSYEAGRISGLSFIFAVGKQHIPFSLPVRTESIYNFFVARHPATKKRYTLSVDTTNKLRIQAERVAWRQLLRWIQAQLALIETGMVHAEEVFLPYMVNSQNRTLYQEFRDSHLLAAPKGNS
jgi:hypothetical protein